MSKITGVLLFAALVFFATFFVFNFEVNDGSLRKKSKHSWCFTNCGGATGEANGYSTSNTDCQNRCTANNGISCGKNWQNCCVSNQCASHFYGDICNQRIPVANCTSP